MRFETSVLELSAVVNETAAELAIGRPLSLRMLPGESALIEGDSVAQLGAFADLCSGLIVPLSGHVRFLGRDWRELADEYAAAMRGRIGRVFAAGAWMPFLDVATNILLPSLHHTRRQRHELHAEALTLAHEFGLPGLPLDQPDDLSQADLDRAALVRAFLGEPLLVLVEDRSDLLRACPPAVMSRAAAVCDRGGAIIWFSRHSVSLPVNYHLRLSHHGLASVQEGT